MRLVFPFKSLQSGLLLTYVLLIAFSLGLLAWRVGSSLDASRLSETKRDQQGRTVLAASAAGDWVANFRDQKIDLVGLESAANTLARELDQPITLLDYQGHVLVDTEYPGELGKDKSNLPEVAGAIQGLSLSVMRYDADDQGDALFSAAPVRFGRDFVGIIRLELPMGLIEQASQQFWLRIIGATVLAGVVTIVVSILFARALADPIARISRAASAMANGELNQRIIVTGPREYERLAHSFNFMAERISRLMEDQRAFVADAAHELRTPLTTIRLRAEALNEGAKDDPEVASQFLQDITSETDRLSRIVDQLLALSRLETGLIKPRREPVAMNRLAEQVVRDSKLRTEDANLNLCVNSSELLPFVNVDVDQMRQVIINLISNSIKFTPAGGTITIDIAAVKQPQLVNHLPQGDWVVTTVRDTGEGIPADDLPFIFERFYRSDKARARETGGTGLGLAIVKTIIDSHSGYVWAASEGGKGTQVSFALPQAAD